MRFGLNFVFAILILHFAYVQSGDISQDVIMSKIAGLLQEENMKLGNLNEVENIISNAFQQKKEAELLEQAEDSFKGSVKFYKPVAAENIFSDRVCSGKKVSVSGRSEITGDLQTEFFNTETLELETLHVATLYNPHHPITIEGSFEISAIQTEKSLDASEILLQGLNTWKLFKHEHFQANEHVKDWSFAELGSCENSKLNNIFLGGPCKLNKKIMKVFKELPPHSKVRVAVTAHLFDNWQGESLSFFMQDQKVWTKKTKKSSKYQTLDMCGHPGYGDPHMNLHIDQTIDHTENFLTLTFETNLKKDACEASYAIDDVFLYLQ